jgi:hypothetical protein
MGHWARECRKKRDKLAHVVHVGDECDILAQGLIELIEYSYQQDASSFSEAFLERTSGLSVLGPEQSWDG